MFLKVKSVLIQTCRVTKYGSMSELPLKL